jgi:hypothetical protein
MFACPINTKSEVPHLRSPQPSENMVKASAGGEKEKIAKNDSSTK